MMSGYNDRIRYVEEISNLICLFMNFKIVPFISKFTVARTISLFQETCSIKNHPFTDEAKLVTSDDQSIMMTLKYMLL